MKLYTLITTIAVAQIVLIASLKAETITPESDIEYHERMKWFTDAQFGLFIHYGLYSNLAGEWKGEPVEKYAEWIQRWGKITPEEYISLASNFRPDKLDADLWVKTAKDAGMKYMVITSKHHEGFCLWDSAFTEYDLGEATDFDRDILGELKAACDEHGLKFGTYYSLTDWHHPSQRAQQAEFTPKMNDKETYVTYMKGQLKELIDRYDPAIMWFDGDWSDWWTMEDGTDLYNYLRNLSPNLIINNRVSKRAFFKKDFGTPENSTPGVALDHLWEACWTVNHSWGYKKSDTNWKTNDELIQKQIDINTKGGNLLLNVGPKGDGSWPEAAFGQLAAMGEWNKTHEQAVYGTEFVDLPAQGWGKLAQSKGSSLEGGEFFAYVFNWPEDGKLFIKRVLANKVEATTYDGTPIPLLIREDGLELDLKEVKATQHTTVLRLKHSGLKAVPAPTVDLGLTGNELILQAPDALRNGTKVDLKNKEHLSFTRKPFERANWKLNVPAPGKYKVKALYTGTHRKGEVNLNFVAGNKRLKLKLPATETMDTYSLMEIAVLDLQQVGTVDCEMIFGGLSQADLYHLKTIILVPHAQ